MINFFNDRNWTSLVLTWNILFWSMCQGELGWIARFTSNYEYNFSLFLSKS